MILTEEQIKEFEVAAEPLIKWLNDNCHPHCKVIVENDSAELVEDSCRIKNDKHIKD